MRTMIICIGLLLAAPANAANYTITAIRSGYAVCQWLPAPDPKHAFQDCLDFTMVIPLWAVVITPTQVCKSTHRVTQVSPALLVKWGYDMRLSAVATPKCP